MLKKIMEVFTKEYRERTEYLEFIHSMRGCIKLKENSESIDVKIARLMETGYASGCHIETGDLAE